MSAAIKACLVGNSLKNTGKECDASMGATAMLIAVPPTTVITANDLLDIAAWATPLIHGSKATRIYPFFGNQAPINTINNNPESDVNVTLDDGTQVFLRYGVYNRLYETISGGLCYAEALQGLNKSGYRIIEIDQTGQAILHKNGDSTWGGIISTFMYSPSPILADFKSTPYKNRFQYSMTPTEYVKFGELFAGFDPLLDMMGLIDAHITKAAAATTTKLKIGVEANCSETDLVALFGSALGTHTNNFRVEDVAALGTPVAISAAAIVTGWIELTGTFTSAHTYRVWGATPAVWLSNLVEGYDAEDGYVDILIP